MLQENDKSGLVGAFYLQSKGTKMMALLLNRFQIQPLLLGLLIAIGLTYVLMTSNRTVTAAVAAPAADIKVERGSEVFQPLHLVTTATPPYEGCGRDELSDIYYACRRNAVLQGCGEVCNTEMSGAPSLFFNAVRKHMACRALWSNSAIDEAVSDKQWPPPQKPPAIFMDDFLYHGRVRGVWGRYYQNRYAGGDGKVKNWTRRLVDSMIKQALAGTLGGNYGRAQTNHLIEGLRRMHLYNKTVLVIGSENPWVEACVLAVGAGEVHTLEYGLLNSMHPQIKTFTPDEFRRRVLDNSIVKYDRIVTFSSIEHSGLGRYGDALNPWGDLQTMARMWCIANDDAQALVGVPGDTCFGGMPELIFNAHRCYQGHTWTHLTANWEQLSKGPDAGCNRFYILRKLPPLSPVTGDGN